MIDAKTQLMLAAGIHEEQANAPQYGVCYCRYFFHSGCLGFKRIMAAGVTMFASIA
jgi:hypothetical protein